MLPQRRGWLAFTQSARVSIRHRGCWEPWDALPASMLVCAQSTGVSAVVPREATFARSMMRFSQDALLGG
jgi:hypothetical protein